MITDKLGRRINYLRLAIVDRCNLRCTYCMPEQGLDWIKQKDLLTDEELYRISKVFTELGVNKIRITGGEPFVRKNCMGLIANIAGLEGIQDLSLTTNGLLTYPYIPQLKALGIKSVNLSLDTMDKDRFLEITRRNSFDKVIRTLDALLKHDIKVKINTVVMEGRNITDIIPLIQLAEKNPIDIRFIEEMPFNGSNKKISIKWDHRQILDHIKAHFPTINKTIDPKSSTSYNYQIPGFQGSVGIIAAYTRSFCGDCNRIRITPAGVLRTCLYSESGINLKDQMRSGKNDDVLKNSILDAIQNKPNDGWVAQELNQSETANMQSMATIGG